MPEMRQIILPEDLCAGAERRYVEHFANITELLTFVLRELNEGSAQVDEAEERIIEIRLKELGYL